LPGAAAALGAYVTQTDRFPEAVTLSRANARGNRLRHVRQVAADWRAWPLCGAWPAVLGADLTYERASHGSLLAVLEQSVAPGGAAYLADPGRPMSLEFFSRAEARGWRVEMEEVLAEDGPRVWIYTLRPPGVSRPEGMHAGGVNKGTTEPRG
jgi:predicted nicotinamide N-methyase